MESRFENYRIRKLIILYHLEDHSIMISEPRQVNSGTPQGVFLQRQMVLKQDGSGLPMLPPDFRIGLDVGILGRSIRIYDIDQYTREWTRIHTHGGKLFENLCQAVARDIMAANMPLIEAAGYQIVLTVHDEIIAEAPDEPQYNAEHMASLLAANPSWAPDIPLAAAGFETYRYRKG